MRESGYYAKSPSIPEVLLQNFLCKVGLHKWEMIRNSDEVKPKYRLCPACLRTQELKHLAIGMTNGQVDGFYSWEGMSRDDATKVIEESEWIDDEWVRYEKEDILVKEYDLGINFSGTPVETDIHESICEEVYNSIPIEGRERKNLRYKVKLYKVVDKDGQDSSQQ